MASEILSADLGVYNVGLPANLTINSFTPTFLNMAGQMGIFRAGTRLGFWDSDNSVSWSSNFELNNFEPSLENLAGNTIFGDVQGRIVTIKSYGDGFIIYSTKSIVGVDFTETGSMLWDGHPILSDVGIGYSRAVATGDSDTTHFIYSNSGIYTLGMLNKVAGKYDIKPIFTELYDFLKESRQPVGLQVIDGRFLFFSLIDADYINGKLMHSKGYVNPLITNVRLADGYWDGTFSGLPEYADGNTGFQFLKTVIAGNIGFPVVKYARLWNTRWEGDFVRMETDVYTAAETLGWVQDWPGYTHPQQGPNHYVLPRYNIVQQCEAGQPLTVSIANPTLSPTTSAEGTTVYKAGDFLYEFANLVNTDSTGFSAVDENDVGSKIYMQLQEWDNFKTTQQATADFINGSPQPTGINAANFPQRFLSGAGPIQLNIDTKGFASRITLRKYFTEEFQVTLVNSPKSIAITQTSIGQPATSPHSDYNLGYNGVSGTVTNDFGEEDLMDAWMTEALGILPSSPISPGATILDAVKVVQAFTAASPSYISVQLGLSNGSLADYSSAAAISQLQALEGAGLTLTSFRVLGTFGSFVKWSEDLDPSPVTTRTVYVGAQAIMTYHWSKDMADNSYNGAGSPWNAPPNCLKVSVHVQGIYYVNAVQIFAKSNNIGSMQFYDGGDQTFKSTYKVDPVPITTPTYSEAVFNLTHYDLLEPRIGGTKLIASYPVGQMTPKLFSNVYPDYSGKPAAISQNPDQFWSLVDSQGNTVIARLPVDFENGYFGGYYVGMNDTTHEPYLITSGYTIGGSYHPPVDYTFTLPGAAFNMQAGSINPLYATFKGSLMYDLQLKKWGKYAGDHKLIIATTPVNSDPEGSVSYYNFGVDAGILDPNGSIIVFDSEPADGYISYGKIGYYRLGFNQGLEIRIGFRNSFTGSIRVRGSLDEHSLSPDVDETTEYLEVVDSIVYCNSRARWYVIEISGNYDLQYMEFRANISGRR